MPRHLSFFLSAYRNEAVAIPHPPLRGTFPPGEGIFPAIRRFKQQFIALLTEPDKHLQYYKQKPENSQEDTGDDTKRWVIRKNSQLAANEIVDGAHQFLSPAALGNQGNHGVLIGQHDGKLGILAVCPVGVIFSPSEASIISIFPDCITENRRML